RRREYAAGTFSFNVAGGRCETCEGAGYLEVEMVFMADVYVPCDDCGGKRFKPEVLDVRVNGRTIYDVLELTVDEAIRFFPREEKLGQALWQLQQVGLGHLRLGQPATTLSGGEAQRLKVSRVSSSPTPDVGCAQSCETCRTPHHRLAGEARESHRSLLPEDALVKTALVH